MQAFEKQALGLLGLCCAGRGGVAILFLPSGGPGGNFTWAPLHHSEHGKLMDFCTALPGRPGSTFHCHQTDARTGADG